VIIVVCAILIDFPILGELKQKLFQRDLNPVLGLDLRGGMQILLQSPEGYQIDQQTLQVASSILEKRSNALGVSEVVFQVAGDRYIVGEFPGLENIEDVIGVIKQTGLLEFVDVGQDFLEPGTIIQTDNTSNISSNTANTEEAENSADNEISPIDESTLKIYHTVITGADLDSVIVTAPQNPSDGYAVAFKLKSDGAEKFAEHTRNNIGQLLAIVLDHEVISTPVIRQAIEGGEGTISGSGENAFTFDQAQ